MVLLWRLAVVAMFSFTPKAASGCRFLLMEVWIQHRQYVSLLLRSCFLFSEIAVQKPFYLLYIFPSASVGENIPKAALLRLFLGCRHRQAGGWRESFFSALGRAFFHSEIPDSALLRYLLQNILSLLPAFLVVLAILFRLGTVRQWDSRRFVFLLCTEGFCFNHEYPDFFILWLAQTTFAEQSGPLLPRTSLLSFRVVLVVLWRIQLRVCLLRFPKQLSSETLLLCAPECSEIFL